jgi:hypothetical protein
MTYSSHPPAPGRHHLGPADGGPSAAYDRPGVQRDPAVWWGGEPEQSQPGFGRPDGQPAPAPAQQGGWPEAQQSWQDPGPSWQDPGSRWRDPGPSWQDPTPAWRQPAPGGAGLGAGRSDAPPSWQPPYQGAVEFQRDYPQAPAWEPAPPPEPAAPKRPEGEPISSTMRGQVVDRIIRINTSHALQAADRLGTKLAVGPHCLALFSIDTVSGRYQRLSTATRLILDGEDAESLPDLLRDLTARAHEKVAEARAEGQRWEPRTPLTGLVLRSESFDENTAYIGLGVSTLDTPEIPWSRAKQSVTGADGLHLRGQGMIYLHDGTAVHVVRRAQMASGQHEITANRRVDSQYQSRRDEHLIERATHQGDESWGLMRQLHEVLATA